MENSDAFTSNVNDAIYDNWDAVQEYRASGNGEAFNKIMSSAMENTGGRMNPARLSRVIHFIATSDGLLDKDTRESVIDQMERMESYRNGRPLDDDEGFLCTECGWRDMTAPMYSGDDTQHITECGECGATGLLVGDEIAAYREENDGR